MADRYFQTFTFLILQWYVKTRLLQYAGCLQIVPCICCFCLWILYRSTHWVVLATHSGASPPPLPIPLKNCMYTNTDNYTVIIQDVQYLYWRCLKAPLLVNFTTYLSPCDMFPHLSSFLTFQKYSSSAQNSHQFYGLA